MTDFGEVDTILGIKIIRNWEDGTLSMGQELYTQRILERFHMADCEGRSTPLPAGLKLSKTAAPQTDAEKEAMASVPYREAVGSLMYLMICTRPDLAAAVQMVSRFSSNPGPQHWEAVKHIFRYLQKTKSLKLTFRKQGVLKLEGFSDSDWESCEDTREAVWELSQLQELEYRDIGVPVIHMDSQSAKQLIENPVFHDKSKHIQGKMHYVREVAMEGRVSFAKVHTSVNLADILTKGVPAAKTILCRNGMGLA